MKLSQYLLNEEKMDNSDAKKLKALIKTPKNTTIVLKSFSKDYDEEEREVNVSKTKSGVGFSYNMDFYELTNTLVDMVDDLGAYTFKTSNEKNINTTYFEISLKN